MTINDNDEPATMMALRAHRRGGPETLQYERAPRPEPAAGEVLIGVRAAAITFAELTWEETWTRNGVDRTPTIPSHEVSGAVVGVGDGVGEDHLGVQMYGLVPFDRNGAAAEFVALPFDCVAPKPDRVDHITAAATPIAALTAWQALVDHAGVRPGEAVLVHGGAGAVGGFVTQLAHHLGAHVTATVRARDVERARRYGADVVVDYETEQFDSERGRYDVVVDTVGGSTLERSYAVLRPGGRLITLQAPPSQQRAAEFGVTATFFIVRPDAAQLVSVGDMVNNGRLEVTVAATFPLADGPKAFASGADPHRRSGKTVLVIGDDPAATGR